MTEPLNKTGYKGCAISEQLGHYAATVEAARDTPGVDKIFAL